MADNTQETAVKITGDGSSAQAAMKQTADAVTSGVDRMKSALDNIGGAFGKVQGALIGLAAIVGGGKFFKAAIDESNKLTGETMRLAKTLGITAEEATTLNTALGDIYTDTDTYVGAYQRFASQLRRNEEGLQAMGLKTRDANGQLRAGNDVFREAIKMVGDYAPGLDQTTAAQKLFGKSIDDVMKLQKLNNEVLAEAAKKNEELGLIITDQNVAASKAYKAAMNDVGDVLTAVMKVIGDAVMPIFTELAQYFAQTGPYVIAIFKGALTGLLAVFRTVQAVVKTVGAVIFEIINHMIDQLGNFSDLISALLHGDFEGAANAAKNFGNRWVQAFTNIKDAAKDAFGTAQEDFANDLERTWGPKKAATMGGKKGTKHMGDLKDHKDAKDESRMAAWSAELEARKVAYEKENDLREMSKQQEFQYWQDISQRKDLTDKERIQVTKATATAELAVLKEAQQQRLQLSEEAITAYQKQQMDVLDATRAEAQFEVDIGLKQKSDMLKQEVALEDERYRITKEAVAARLELLSKDPTKNAVALQKLNDELAQVERDHSRNMRQNTMDQTREQLKDWQTFFNNISGSFGNVINGLINRTLTLGGAVKSIFGTLLSSVTNFLVQIAARKLEAYAIDKLFKLGLIKGEAAAAGAGAAASQASIPIVGPELAIAAMASVSSAVLGSMGTLASARQGYAIPAGTNPLTQLHEEEMVLPKEESQVVKDMARGNNGGAPVVFKGTSAGDFFIAHKRDMVKFMKSLNRNFEFS